MGLYRKMGHFQSGEHTQALANSHIQQSREVLNLVPRLLGGCGFGLQPLISAGSSEFYFGWQNKKSRRIRKKFRHLLNQ